MPIPNRILLLGGTGKVGSEIAPLVLSTGHVPIIASRRGTVPPKSSRPFSTLSQEAYSSIQAVKFSWDDESTWAPALGMTNDNNNNTTAEPVSAVWIIVPGYADPGAMTAKFIDLARRGGTRRFVLLSSSQIKEGGPAMGATHKVLRERGDRREVEWAVLRPSWFQQNYAIEQTHIKAIKEDNKLYSATGAGRMPVVSTKDIAAVAAYALTTKDELNKEFVVLGPELLSYEQLADIFTEVLGRKITYQELSVEQLAERHESFGLEKGYAMMLAGLDTIIKDGGEDRMNTVVQDVTGRPARPFREFVEQERETWL